MPYCAALKFMSIDGLTPSQASMLRLQHHHHASLLKSSIKQVVCFEAWGYACSMPSCGPSMTPSHPRRMAGRRPALPAQRPGVLAWKHKGNCAKLGWRPWHFLNPCFMVCLFREQKHAMLLEYCGTGSPQPRPSKLVVCRLFLGCVHQSAAA